MCIQDEGELDLDVLAWGMRTIAAWKSNSFRTRLLQGLRPGNRRGQATTMQSVLSLPPGTLKVESIGKMGSGVAATDERLREQLGNMSLPVARRVLQANVHRILDGRVVAQDEEGGGCSTRPRRPTTRARPSRGCATPSTRASRSCSRSCRARRRTSPSRPSSTSTPTRSSSRTGATPPSRPFSSRPTRSAPST